MKTVYIADDGTKFDDGIACANYEQECKRRDLENYSTLPLVHFTYNAIIAGTSDEFGYDVIHIRDKKDLEILNKAYKLKNFYCFKGYGACIDFDDSYIGKNIIFNTDLDGNICFYKDEPTFEVFRANIEKALNSIADQLKAFEN